MEICQLEDVLHQRAETYSGGMKRRLNLAIALLNAPQILYLDEPTVGIDARSRQTIVAAIAALKAEAVTIVYTSHYMEEVESLCDAMVVIDRGRVVALGKKEDVLRRHGGSVLRISLEAPVPETARAGLASLNARWIDDTHLELDAADSAMALSLLDQVSGVGARIAQMQYGAGRLENAYLAMLDQGAEQTDESAA